MCNVLPNGSVTKIIIGRGKKGKGGEKRKERRKKRPIE